MQNAHCGAPSDPTQQQTLYPSCSLQLRTWVAQPLPLTRLLNWKEPFLPERDSLPPAPGNVVKFHRKPPGPNHALLLTSTKCDSALARTRTQLYKNSYSFRTLYHYS